VQAGRIRDMLIIMPWAVNVRNGEKKLDHRLFSVRRVDNCNIVVQVGIVDNTQ